MTPYGRVTTASEHTHTIYSVSYSILHVHKMLVFSRWGYNHNKLVADAVGASQGYKKKKGSCGGN